MHQQIANLEKIVGDFWDRISQEGEKYRKEILIPFCDKYKLAFSQGMGTFFIYDKKWKNTEYTCAELYTGFADLHLNTNSKLMKNPEFVSELKQIINILNHEITYNQLFGYYVNDYSSF